MAKQKTKKQALSEFAKEPLAQHIEQSNLHDFATAALYKYGSYVVEERAIPDYRDGLKPSHRAVLWSLCGLALRPTSGFKKAARTVGDAIGKYHPHGDAGVYGAMVTVANTNPPLVAGSGNWGSPVDNAAAYRYTEARMSRFAHLFIADSKYLEVTPMIPNFSNDDKIPLYMPALLPYMLFNGSVPAPAYGVRTGHPSFSFKSVSKIVINMLRGKEYGAGKLAKALKVYHETGSEDITHETDYLDFMKAGKGAIHYAPLVNKDHKGKLIQIRSFCPFTLSSLPTIERNMGKIRDIKGVKKVWNAQGKKSKGAGPYGALINVSIQNGVSADDFEEIADRIDDIVCSKISYRLGVTIRKVDEKHTFRYMDFVSYFRGWIKYRINLELRMLKWLLATAEKELHLNEVYLFAIQNMDKLLKILPKVLVAKDPDVELSRTMKIPVEDAKIILDRKIRQLAKLEEKDLKDKIKALRDEIKALKLDQKNPGERAARDTEDRVARYLKNPDETQSGLPIA